MEQFVCEMRYTLGEKIELVIFSLIEMVIFLSREMTVQTNFYCWARENEEKRRIRIETLRKRVWRWNYLLVDESWIYKKKEISRVWLARYIFKTPSKNQKMFLRLGARVQTGFEVDSYFQLLEQTLRETLLNVQHI